MGQVAIKWCRHCGKVIPLTTDECPYCLKNTLKGLVQTVNCPFCGEEIKATAVKCRHCHEFLDGRSSPEQAPPGPTVIIEKAIIAQGDPDGGIRMLRPDGTPIRLAPDGRPMLAGETAGAKALPRGEAPPPHEAIETSAVPARAAPRGAPARRAPAAAPEPAGKRPAHKVCPNCSRVVFEDDRFCENCGHDLSRPVAKRYVAVDKRSVLVLARYALILSAGAPAFLAAHLALGTVLSAAAGVLAALVALRRMARASHKTDGRAQAVAAVVFGLLWIVLGAACF